jgi:hypothetical protein
MAGTAGAQRSCCRAHRQRAKQPRFNPTPIAAVEARRWSRSATTEGQARGGARDWNGARRVEKKVIATQFECSTRRTANGTGSCGVCGSNEVAARWIVAQIAQ